MFGISNWLSSSSPDRQKKAGVVLISFFLSLILWGLVTLNQTYETRITLPIKVYDIPDTVKVTEPVTHQLSLDVKGTGIDLLGEFINFKPDTLRLPFDRQFFEYPSVPVEIYQQRIRDNLNSQIDILHTRPENIVLSYTPKVYKVVPIIFDTEITMNPAYQLSGPPEILEDSVTILGAREILDTIWEWHTERTPTELITRPQMISVPVVDTFKGIEVSPSSIDVFITPQKFTEKKLEIPIEILNIPEDKHVRLNHQTIRVTCLIPFDQYENLMERSDQFVAQLDFNGFDPLHPQVIPRLNLPNSIFVSSRRPLDVSFVIVNR
ncbi:hypothetical protein [Pontibacter sp. G13]|uniref:hypothetical protein n=1 Tax=Pontibacter sp. G13 TaxID=3074898 RepID=UPI0028892C9C|nr:hypothetical protein [Pontibacter sp. G13]WNJ18034.1 hypothetical protein RJD25_24525 [Pontibacter sp. G13]